jgi:membrane protease YdiL (CAAX protease family)
VQKQNYHFWLFLVGFYAVWILRATWFYSSVDLSIPDSTWRLVFSNGLKFILWVLPAVAYVVWHDRQNPLTTMKVSTRIDRRGVLIGLRISIVYLACVYLLEYFTSQRTLAMLLRTTPLTILATLVSVSFSPVSEEWLFRGFVLPKLNENMHFWPANLVQAALFVAIHWPNWIWVGGFHWSLVTTSVSILLLGLLFGWLTRSTNSIWPGVAVHIANNFLTAFLG